MTSILILQNEIKAYRKPLYNMLAEFYDVVVLHSGSQSVTEHDLYREIITPKKRFWRFYLQLHSPLRKMIKDFEVIIAMFDLSWPAYLAPLFWRKRPKYILWGHWYSTNRIANFIRNYLMKRADGLLLYGGEEVERMVDSGIARHKIVVAPNTVQVQKPTDFSGEQKRSLTFIGRLQAGSRRNSKRADILIEAFANLQGVINKNIFLEIVGSGEEEEPLKRLVAKFNLADKVIFHGHVDDDNKLAVLFSKSIALVSPGHVGLSVLQSFSYGVPVVTGKAVQYREETQHLYNVLTGELVVMGPEYYNIQHGRNSLLVETMKELEVALEKLCNEPSYAAELGSNSYQYYMQERSLNKMVDGFKKAIER